MKVQSLLLVYLLISIVQSKSQLLFISNLFRHGARGPVHPNLNSDSKFNTFYKDQLTPTGQRQHFILGQTLRERYIIGDKFGLGLSQKYNNTEIYVQSTNFNRTINSALSQLNGLYPPGEGPYIPSQVEGYLWMPPYEGATPPSIGQQALPYTFQNIPVHNVPIEKDYLLTPNFPTFCPGMLQITENFFQSKFFLDKHDEINEKYKDVMEQFTNVLDLPEPLNFMESEAIWDTLIADKFNGQPCKGWENITKEMWEGITQLDNLYWFLVFGGDPDNVKIGASSVLASWIEYSEIKLGNIKEDVSEKLENLKYVMYSAHDLNVQNVLIALQLSNFNCVWDYYNTGKTNALNCNHRPYYAASLIYELYVTEDNEDLENPFVKIMYDGEYQYLCGVKNTVCNYEDFKQFIYDYVYIDGNPKKGTYSEQLCKAQTEDKQFLAQKNDYMQQRFVIMDQIKNIKQQQGLDQNKQIEIPFYKNINFILGLSLAFLLIILKILKQLNSKI